MWPIGYLIMETNIRRKRNQQEKRQDSIHAQLITVAVSHALQPQDNPMGPIKSIYPSGGKTNKGECCYWPC